jgi:hypothetical protein
LSTVPDIPRLDVVNFGADPPKVEPEVVSFNGLIGGTVRQRSEQ